MSGLGQVLESLVQACTPTTDDYNKRISLIQRIERVLQRCGHVEDLKVIPYGSFVSGFYNSTSDLDLAICGTYPTSRLKPASLAEIFRGAPEAEDVPLHKLDRRTKTDLLREAGRRLQAAGLARRGALEYILHARVPIIKFEDPTSGIEVDLCLGCDATPFKAWSVARVASVHPAFGKLFRVVKVWAKAHSINDGASHMFNSWCLTLVVISFLQTFPQPPLLPPLYELLYDNPPEHSTPRLLQGGGELPSQAYEIMEVRTAKAQEVYGSRPCKPLEELFRDFVEDGSRKLRSLLAREGSFLRGTRVSAFYGKMLSRPFPTSYVLCVEDPYDDTDNTARTLGTWEGHSGTIHYVTSVFERTLRHLNGHIASASTPTTIPTNPPSTAASSFNGPADSRLTAAPDWSSDCGTCCSTSSLATNSSLASAASSTSRSRSGSESGRRSGGGASTSGGDAAATSSSSPSGSSLAATLVFLFGTELLSRLPELSTQLLGQELCGWARGALLAGRPAGEVHEELLRKMGAANEFVSFDSFKRRHNIRVHNEAKYATPEEKAAAAEKEAARKAARKARDVEKRAAKKPKDSGEQARTAAKAGREVAARVSGSQQAAPAAATAAAPAVAEAEAVASAAVAAALGTKQLQDEGKPTGGGPPRAPVMLGQRKARNSASRRSEEAPAAAAAAAAPDPPPAPPEPQQQPPQQQQQSQQQRQPRVRLSNDARTALAKALSHPAPASGAGAGAGTGTGRASARSSNDGAGAAATSAAAAALRGGGRSGGGTDPQRPATHDATTNGHRVEAAAQGAAAAAAAAVEAVAAKARRDQRRQSRKGNGEAEDMDRGGSSQAEAGRGATTASRTDPIEAAMQGLSLGASTSGGARRQETGSSHQRQQQQHGEYADFTVGSGSGSGGGGGGEEQGVAAARDKTRRREPRQRRSEAAGEEAPPRPQGGSRSGGARRGKGPGTEGGAGGAHGKHR